MQGLPKMGCIRVGLGWQVINARLLAKLDEFHGLVVCEGKEAFPDCKGCAQDFTCNCPQVMGTK